MNKKTYKQPVMKVVELELTDFVCQSQVSYSTPRNESYEVKNNTSIWFTPDTDTK